MKTVERIVNYLFGAIIVFVAAMIILVIGSKYPIVYVICPIVILITVRGMVKLYRGEIPERSNDDDCEIDINFHDDYTENPAYDFLVGNDYNNPFHK